MTHKNKYDVEVIKEVGRTIISNTQEIRVQLVRDPNKGIKVACQKWWRTSVDEEWNTGKGFFLSGREAYEIGEMLQSVGSDIIHVKN